jgi:hypothetical protein
VGGRPPHRLAPPPRAALGPADRRHLVRDLGSRNGSAIHGAPLGEIPRALDDNAVLRLGDVLAVYERTRGAVVDSPLVDRDAVPGDALAILAFRTALARAARDPSPVLILGESGSGKERSAAELHRLSGRPGPLVALNCAALSPQLIESQLFGHQRGAFTGATAAQPGLFRAAERGTLWLDEIGELPLDLQPKLLRAIESGEILPIGATAHQRVDVRVIAATNRVLADEVVAGGFRRDLYARLALWELALPPLARRRVDILPWLERLAAAWSTARGLPAPPAFALDPRGRRRDPHCALARQPPRPPPPGPRARPPRRRLRPDPPRVPARVADPRRRPPPLPPRSTTRSPTPCAPAPTAPS